MTRLNERKGYTRGMLLGGIAALTVVLVAGMKFFMSEDPVYVTEQPAGQERLFKDEGEGAPPPGVAPAARSESSSGGALDMFSKTNAGYYGEEDSTATAAAPAAAAVKKSTVSAMSAAKKTVRPQEKKTVIPRMKPSSLGGVSPTAVTPGGAGQGMPDISGMIKQAQEQAGGK